jgi:inorganic pyrophosphatase
MGSIVPVKVLGSMALIDEGETDHKIIVLRQDDPHFDSIHSMDDLELYRPGVLSRLVDWLTNYKTTDGKPVNKLKSSRPSSAEGALRTILETHVFYNDLLAGKTVVEHTYALPATVEAK